MLTESRRVYRRLNYKQEKNERSLEVEARLLDVEIIILDGCHDVSPVVLQNHRCVLG